MAGGGRTDRNLHHILHPQQWRDPLPGLVSSEGWRGPELLWSPRREVEAAGSVLAQLGEAGRGMKQEELGWDDRQTLPGSSSDWQSRPG